MKFKMNHSLHSALLIRCEEAHVEEMVSINFLGSPPKLEELS